jgi:drug/metabolite transporter (DMT)-like permease
MTFSRISRKELALVSVTIFWGGTFSIVHLAMSHSGPLFFVGIRFLTASLISFVAFRGSWVKVTKLELIAGVSIGASMFAGYSLQTYGLQTISGSASAFITAMYVPLVPLLQWLVLRRTPQPMSIVGVLCAFVGLLMLAGPGPGSFTLSSGEFATLLSAFAIAAEIILISRFAGRVDIHRVTAMQLFSAGSLSLVSMPLASEHVPSFSWVWAAAALGLGAASIVIQFTMNWAQQEVSPTRATLIYAGEPVWGGVVGRFAGDRMSALAIVGAAFILLGVLVSEIKLPVRKRRSSPA